MIASEQFRPGDVLLDGRAIVLAAKRDYILAVMPGAAAPFVTWWVSARGEVLSGVYERELGDAIRSLMDRAGRKVA